MIGYVRHGQSGRASFRGIVSATLVCVLALLIAAPSNAQLAIPGTDLSVGWDVNFNNVTGLFEYRYTVTNNGLANLVDNVRWTVAEDGTFGHAGLHHEGNFLNDGGLYQYDRILGGFPGHNYDWRNLDIPAGNSITIGFDDIHGPTMELWRIEQGAAFGVGGLPPVIGAPVPRLPAIGAAVPPNGAPGGLGTIALQVGPGQIKAYTVSGAAAVPVAGGWQYKYFLTNTGNVPIGPDPNPPIDNHADYFVSEHPLHVALHHQGEAFNMPQNAMATAFGWDDGTGHGHGPVASPDNYFWHKLGDGGIGPWVPGQTITLGFFDIHGPAMVPWGGWVIGSESSGSFSASDQQVPVPAPEIPEPSAALLALIGAAMLTALRHKQSISRIN
jgi:hypothetical protein